LARPFQTSTGAQWGNPYNILMAVENGGMRSGGKKTDGLGEKGKSKFNNGGRTWKGGEALANRPIVGRILVGEEGLEGMALRYRGYEGTDVSKHTSVGGRDRKKLKQGLNECPRRGGVTATKKKKGRNVRRAKGRSVG